VTKDIDLAIVTMALDDAIAYNIGKANKTKNMDRKFNILQDVESFQELKDKLKNEEE
jgi:hypothetical protein